MGITTSQQLRAVATGVEQSERRTRALENALVEAMQNHGGDQCPVCPAYRTHPAPFYCDGCKCAADARARVAAWLDGDI